MISVDDLIKAVRFKQHDNNEVKFSDYDIIQSLNEALRYINQSYALKNSDFLEKVVEYRLEDGGEYTSGFELPDDFLTLVSILTADTKYPLHPCNAQKKPNNHEFKIVAGRLYVTEDVDMMYRFSLEAKTAEDILDIPQIFFDVIVKLTGMILNNAETDIMREAVDRLVADLVPARRYANRIIYPVWKV